MINADAGRPAGGDGRPANTNDQQWDCIIVGAGPAGLTAALYMARYRRAVLVLHDGTARALRIPLTHNAPGFPDGITGPDLVARMVKHAEHYGALVTQAQIEHVAREDERFVLRDKRSQMWRARSLILATGIHLNQIPLPDAVHEEAIKAGVLRYCPICDAYEQIGKRIGVIGCDTNGAKEALFLRRYSPHITLIPAMTTELDGDDLETLAAVGIEVLRSPVQRYDLKDQVMRVRLVAGETRDFDVVYPALGVTPRTELAVALGLKTDECGCVDAQTPFETQIPGLYSAGDIVEGLDQINVAIAQGAVAATKAHNWLRDLDGECLP
ncbi:NAD(P)/FAD-dependent oxidoreductase [Sphingomonas beigongshangi]|uniref:NAD(P)/FAD-dependent oxidoreductase n=1 Tax=Sphingomonas beigongshangi TaxID=2782540 RepID=UPI001AEE1A3A|nr:NAD(P)/FAD-dependent oxidoreductase [Sphingomonas beigongshangi]